MSREISLPRISIVTPSYNQGKFLEETIKSVLGQEYPELEYIIIDGGSCDDSVDIIRSYGNLLSYWVSERDSGQSDAINKGFERSSGSILCWLNSDDYLLPGALHEIAQRYSDNPECDVFVGLGQFISPDGNVIATEPLDKTPDLLSLLNWHEGGRIMQPSCFFTRRAWLACGPLDTSLNYAMDLDLWLKFAENFKFNSIQRAMSCARLHSEAKTTANSNRALVDSCIVLLKHGGEEQARRCLEKMAARLTWNEHYVSLVTNSRLFKLLAPVVRSFLGSGNKWEEVNQGGRISKDT